MRCQAYERREIPGHPGYLADSDGCIWAMHGEIALRCGESLNQFGYVRVRVGGRRHVFAHSLVALAFHGEKPAHAQCVRHLNGDKRDNRPENLSWGTMKENSNDRSEHGRSVRGERSPNARLTHAAVEAIIASLAAGIPKCDIAREWGISRSRIKDIETGFAWPHVARPPQLPAPRARPYYARRAKGAP